MKILGLLGDFHASGYYRMGLPLHELSRLGHEVILTNFPAPEDVGWPDVAIVQRSFPRGSLPFLLALKDRGAKLGYELDDWIFSVPPWLPSQDPYEGGKDYTPKHVKFLLDNFHWFDFFLTPSWFLYDKLAPLFPRGLLWKNFLDRDWIDSEIITRLCRERENKQGGGVRIGYTGSSSHLEDFASILPAVVDFLDHYSDAEFVGVGMDWGRMFPPNLQSRTAYIPSTHAVWINQDSKSPKGIRLRGDLGSITCSDVMKPVSFREVFSDLFHYYERMVSSWMDIGVIPLLDTPFNRARSDLKIREYSALGIPFIADPVGESKFVVGGISTAYDANVSTRWDVAFSQLCDKENRFAFSSLGKDEANEHFFVQDHIDELERFLGEVVSETQKA